MAFVIFDDDSQDVDILFYESMMALKASLSKNPPEVSVIKDWSKVDLDDETRARIDFHIKELETLRLRERAKWSS